MVSNEYLDSKGKVHIPSKELDIRFRPSAYVFCKNKEGKFLMIFNERSNQWEFPGGGLELGEDLIECGIREVKEETGYNAKINFELPFFIERDLSYSNSKDEYQHEIHFYYEGQLISEERGNQNFAEGEKILEVKFFSLEELKELDIIYWQKKAFQKYLEKKEKGL
jgi:8-oxo-dGTP pyrophosphatase MutT (NUDIX family)